METKKVILIVCGVILLIIGLILSYQSANQIGRSF